MNTKNRLIEKLLKVAKKHKILTYPVLALVAVISVFHYFFSWSTGAGKRVVAVVMVLVMLVSQSYFLTSSATALIDTEETYKEQQALQEKSSSSLVDEEEDSANNDLVENEKSTAVVTEESVNKPETTEESSENMIDSVSSNDIDSTENVYSEDDGTTDGKSEDDVPVFSEDTLEEDKQAGTQETVPLVFAAYSENGALSSVGATNYTAVKNEDGTYSIDSDTWTAASNALLGMNVAGYVNYIGWYTNIDSVTGEVSGTHISDSNREKFSANVVEGAIRLYAQKNIEKYQVTVTSQNESIGGYIGGTFIEDHVYAVEVVGDQATLTLTDIKKTGYTLSGASLTGTYSNITPKADRTSGQNITLIMKGNSYKQNVDLAWTADKYRIQYAKNEEATETKAFEVTYDGTDCLALGREVGGVESKPGYYFSCWRVDGWDKNLTIGAQITKVEGLQEYLYNNPTAVIRPYYTYKRVGFDKSEVRFQYKLENLVGESVIGQYAINAGNENFTYTLVSDVTTLESEYGIKVEAAAGGIVFKTITGGPIKTNTSGVEVEFKVIDNNVSNDALEAEKSTTGKVKVYIDQCAVSVAPPQIPVKTYDGTTRCPYVFGNHTIPVMAGGKIVEGVYVKYDSGEYESAEAGDRKIILENAQLIFDNPDEKGNYNLVDPNNCTVAGKINKRNVFVKTSVSYRYGRNYVRAGESVNPQILVIEDKEKNTGDNGFIGSDARLLSTLAVPYLKPERDDSIMSSPDETKTYQVLVNAMDTSNYNFIQNSADQTAIAEFDVVLESLTDDLYQFSTVASIDGWYGGSDTIQLQPITTKGYDQIRLTEGGAWQSAITLTKENTQNNKITFQLGDSTTGAYTAWKTITVKIDQEAPEFIGYEIEAKGAGVPGEGLYFPSVGESVSFGNYFNKSVTFSIRYKDERSTPENLYYSLSGTLGNGAWQSVKFGEADADGIAIAKFEILADAVDKIGTIQFYAEDEAGNIETQINTLKRNGADEWAVETSGPEIVSWGVKSGEITVVDGSDRYYSDCTAYVTAQDMTSGIYSITWYINGTPYTERVSSTDVKVSSANFEKAINATAYPSVDGTYTVYAIVTDNAGNHSLQSKPITFMVDDEMPVVDVVRNYDTYQQKVKLEFTTYDKLSGIQYIKVEDENGEADYSVEPAGKNEDGYDVSYCFMETVKKGDYFIEVSDKAGNLYKETITLDKVSSEVPPCPEVEFSPDVNENGWITDDAATASITNVTITNEDKTPVNTKYQLWKDGESSLNVTTIESNLDKEVVSVPDGTYKLRVWCESETGVLCSSAEEDGHTYTIQVDSVEPTITYQLQKGSDNSLIVNFTVQDDISGVNGEKIQVFNGVRPIPVQVKALEDSSAYVGSFQVSEVGNYSIVAEDIAGNVAQAPAFKPMSMKVNAVKNISATSATVGAKVYKGSYDIKSASISYHKFGDAAYIETEALQVSDEATGDLSISAVLDNLENGTNYVYKVTAISEADEVLEYVGYFKTLSNHEAGITITGTARYADGREGAITVGLFAGNSCIRAVEVDTSESNTFVYNNVPDGNYRVVATDGIYTKTARVLIQNGRILYPDTTGLDLVLSGKNTSVEITTDETPQVTADNMDSLFYDETNYTEEDRLLVESSSGTVEFRLCATLMKVSNVAAGEISAMYSAASSKSKLVGAYIDLSLYKFVTDADGNVNKTRIHKLGGGANVSVTIPLGDLANKSGLEVIRIHQDGDTYTGAYLVDQDNNPSTYTITTTQFSTYAVLYDPEKEPETTEEIKDGTLDPSDNGSINVTTEETEINPDDSEVPDDSDDGDEGSEGSSVGSLKSSGSAKTGDATPIPILFGLLSVSIAGYTILRKKAKLD